MHKIPLHIIHAIVHDTCQPAVMPHVAFESWHAIGDHSMLKAGEAMPLQPYRIFHMDQDFSWLAMLQETVKVFPDADRPLMQGCLTSALARTLKNQDKEYTGDSTA